MYRIMLLFFLLMIVSNVFGKPVYIGSKKFTESVILGEVARLSLKQSNLEAQHKAEFGGTRILWNALISGDIDIYPEYTGTLEEELLQKKVKDISEMREILKGYGLGLTEPLGFNNTYAVGMRKKRAAELSINTISDLARFPKLKIGWGAEFKQRKDGWPGLRQRYNLRHKDIRGLDHDVAYRALVQGDIDIVDLYSTDAEIPYYDIKVLEDNLSYFPRYEAVYLYRLTSSEKVIHVLEKLQQQISNEKMVELNRKAKIDKIGSTEVAASFLKTIFNEEIDFNKIDRTDRILKRSFEHFRLVGVSLFFAILAAIPLGIIVAKRKHIGRAVLMVVSGIQTIPALALLVMMIKPLSLLGLSGIGDTPAYIALFLYSLLPIVRNTSAGFQQIPMGLQETAAVLGLSAKSKLWRVELPLALPSILAGIKTALVLNIGFATLGALVGAGGYGQPILTGIRLDDYGLILEGAVPAALLALICQWLFDQVEKYIVSPGLRI